MAMFTAGMKESSCVEIDLKDVDAKTFMALLTFMYTGTVALSEDNAMEILALSNKYWVGPLKKRCEKFLTLHINEQNACELLLAADTHDCKRLRAVAINFITHHFELVSKSWNFMKLEAHMLCDILAQDELPISSEVAAFEAVQRWAWMNAGPVLEKVISKAGSMTAGPKTKEIPKNLAQAANEEVNGSSSANEELPHVWPEERKARIMKGLVAMGKSKDPDLSFEILVPGLGNVLEHIRFPLMSSSYLYQVVEQEPFVKEQRIMRDLMYEAYRYHAVGDRMAAFTEPEELSGAVSKGGNAVTDRENESEDEEEAMARAVSEAAAASGDLILSANEDREGVDQSNAKPVCSTAKHDNAFDEINQSDKPSTLSLTEENQ